MLTPAVAGSTLVIRREQNGHEGSRAQGELYPSCPPSRQVAVYSQRLPNPLSNLSSRPISSPALPPTHGSREIASRGVYARRAPACRTREEGVRAPRGSDVSLQLNAEPAQVRWAQARQGQEWRGSAAGGCSSPWHASAVTPLMCQASWAASQVLSVYGLSGMYLSALRGKGRGGTRKHMSTSRSSP